MHITAIHIKNYRSFERLDLVGLPAATVVVGENASGKSNLLRALRLVLDPSLPDSARRLHAEDFWEGLDAPLAGDEVEVSIELTGFDNDLPAKALLAGCFVGATPLTARLTYCFRPKGQIAPPPAGERPYEFVLYGGTSDQNHLDHDVRHGVWLRVLPALRDAEGDLQNWSRSPLRPLLEGLRLPAAVLDSVSQTINQAASALLAEPKMRGLSDDLAARIKDLVGESFAVRARFDVAAGGSEQMLRVIRLFIEDTRLRAIGDTSLGTANLVFLALLLEGLSPARRGDGVVAQVLAVEEPEAHLHPQVQRALFQSLMKQQTALLLTTHSPHIVSVSKLESIVLLRRIAAHGTRGFTAGGAGLAPHEARDIERYLDVTRAEMLFARGVVLVEGTAELYLVPEFARNMGLDLDQLGVTVCAVHGTDFLPYRRLLGPAAFAIPHVIVTDGDPSGAGLATPGTGIERGRQTLVETGGDTTALDAALALGDRAAAVTALAAQDIFVGPTTLELDILPSAEAAMAAAFDVLVASPERRANFRASVAEVRSGDPATGKGLLSKVSTLGKGRFAQQLAAHLERVPGPSYIEAALERIASFVDP